MTMPGRTFNTPEYNYGHGGQLTDDEITGNRSHYSAEYWEYDSRLGRRWNVDPVVYSWQSSYVVFNNNPVVYNDPKGLKGIKDWFKKNKKNKSEAEQKDPTSTDQNATYSDDGNTRTEGETTQTFVEDCKCYVDNNILVEGQAQESSESGGTADSGSSTGSGGDDQPVLETTTKGAVINLGQQVAQVGRDLLARKNVYHNPYMNDLVSNNMTNGQAALNRQNNLAKVRSNLSPLGKALSEGEKSFTKSIEVTKKIMKGEKNLGLPNKAFSGAMRYAPAIRLVGNGMVFLQVAVAADNIHKSDYNQKVILKEVGGLSGALMMGAMGATYGAALGPAGIIVGGMVGGALGYWMGSGEATEDILEFTKP
jgi:hypothetical protein